VGQWVSWSVKQKTEDRRQKTGETTSNEKLLRGDMRKAQSAKRHAPSPLAAGGKNN